jgi:hypothetical protein
MSQCVDIQGFDAWSNEQRGTTTAWSMEEGYWMNPLIRVEAVILGLEIDP